MTPIQVELVQSTWDKVVPIQDTAANLFYSKLFELDPTLRPLFKDDMTEQRRKLMTMIGVAVKGLTRLDALLPAVRDLGSRHRSYGVSRENYATVGKALLWTLEEGLGPSFTPDVKEAWTAVYSVLATTMQQGAAVAAA